MICMSYIGMTVYELDKSGRGARIDKDRVGGVKIPSNVFNVEYIYNQDPKSLAIHRFVPISKILHIIQIPTSIMNICVPHRGDHW
jgi:hypothetical protein